MAYTITISSTDVTVDESSDTTIEENGTATVIVYPKTETSKTFKIIEVQASNCESTITEYETGYEIELSEPTGDIVITCSVVQVRKLKINDVDVTDNYQYITINDIRYYIGDIIEPEPGPEPEPEPTPGELPTPRASLNDYYWSEIKTLSDALVNEDITTTELSNDYNIAIGGTKEATINNTTIHFRLIGLLHDVGNAGQTLGMTFEQVECNLQSEMYPTIEMADTNNWANSVINTHVLETYELSLPTALYNVITPAKKMCAPNGETPMTDDITYVTSRMWLLSEMEMVGLNWLANCLISEGTQYDYYENDGDKEKKIAGTNTSCNYWTRSVGAYEYSKSHFSYITSSGGLPVDLSDTNTNADTQHYIAPCFCI